MARARDPARDKAKELYLNSNGEMLLKDIASELGKSDSQIRKWKNHDKWDDELKGNVTNETNSNVTNEEELVPIDEQGKPKKKTGYRSNPKNQFTKRNDIAVKHGFYRQFLPMDMLEIIEETQDLTIADRLYFQIETKFAALVQLHKIMFVENRDDTLTDISGSGESTTYKVVYAFEQYAEYIKTEARLTAEWRNVVKQYLELADEYDERRMKIEQMQLNIKKTKAEVAKLDAPETDKSFVIQLQPVAPTKEVVDDGDN